MRTREEILREALNDLQRYKQLSLARDVVLLVILLIFIIDSVVKNHG